MGGQTRWPLLQASVVARDLMGLLEASCERLAIAGSIRRRKPDCGDIELLCIPRLGHGRDLWGTDLNPLEGVSLLDHRVLQLIGMGVLGYRLNVKGKKTFGPLNKLLVHIPSGIPVDLFSTTVSNYGMSLVVRTGPKEFNVRVMSRFKELGMAGHAYGGVTVNEAEVPCPDEVDVFNLLGWPFIPPERRAIYGVPSQQRV
ncbi:MAG: hypothetical protein Q8O40_11945 [Chloroflexota bacterium]|nr:hypothetical protein [Chloroflexota bacterium]